MLEELDGAKEVNTGICAEFHAPTACSNSTTCPGFAHEKKETDSNSSLFNSVVMSHFLKQMQPQVHKSLTCT